MYVSIHTYTLDIMLYLYENSARNLPFGSDNQGAYFLWSEFDFFKSRTVCYLGKCMYNGHIVRLSKLFLWCSFFSPTGNYKIYTISEKCIYV